MKLIFNPTAERFEFLCTFAERYTPKGNFFEWDHTSKIWQTPSATTAINLKDYAELACLLHLATLIPDCITEEDINRGREQEAAEELLRQQRIAAEVEVERLKASGLTGRYALEIDGQLTPVRLALSGAGVFSVKRLNGSTSHVGKQAIDIAKAIAAMTVEDRDAAWYNFGIITGHCCNCGRELSDDKSLASGIGPDCAEKIAAGVGRLS